MTTQNIKNRTATREVNAINEIKKMLQSGKIISVLDVGVGADIKLPIQLKNNLKTSEIKCIDYVGLDCDPDCIAQIKAEIYSYGFNSVKIFQRSVPDFVGVIAKGKLDLAIVHNTLHEVPPRQYPEMFSNLLNLLSNNGKILISDMTSLPEFESEAITMSAEEVENLLEAGGIKALVCPSVTSVPVYYVTIDSSKQRPQFAAMYSAMQIMLKKKQKTFIDQQTVLNKLTKDDSDKKQQYDRVMNSIVRIAKELLSIEEMMSVEIA